MIFRAHYSSLLSTVSGMIGCTVVLLTQPEPPLSFPGVPTGLPRLPVAVGPMPLDLASVACLILRAHQNPLFSTMSCVIGFAGRLLSRQEPPHTLPCGSPGLLRP
jgi:hypothetical protein